MMNNKQLENHLSELLQADRIRDYCPNGMQVEGVSEVHKVVCGVTASQALIDEAIAYQADALFVHHGYFWKGENANIVGMKQRRVKALLEQGINLYAYHLPLDVHPQLGNNAQLARLLQISVERDLDENNSQVVGLVGQFDEPLTVTELTDRITHQLNREPLVEQVNDKPIKTIAWCTGGGQGFIQNAAEQGIDAFLTGEVSEQTIHIAREMGIHFFAAGHHATERYGAMAIAQHLRSRCGLDATFIDIDNPA